MPMSRVRFAKLARIIGALLLVAALGGCSAIKLAYNNLPGVSYWWLDSYLDFNGAQTLRVRSELDQLLAWHRQNELPKLAGMLRNAGSLATDDVTPAQACEMADELRARLLAVAEQAEPAGAELAVSLDDAQLKQLERKYAKINDGYRKDWLDRSRARQLEKRYEDFLDRAEDFYGRLDASQRELLRQEVAQSAFDPRAIDAERKRRQQEALALLRGFITQRTPPEQARAAIHDYVQRIADPPPGPWRDRQQALLQESCRNIAALHNHTTPQQREKAVHRLEAYEKDLRQLVAAR